MPRTTVKSLEARIEVLEAHIESLTADYNATAKSLQQEDAPTVAQAMEDFPVTVEDIDGRVKGDFPCGRCAGTGRYITRIENGKPTGPAGYTCFRCDGKGHHTQVDRKRNYGHTMNYVPPPSA